MFLQAIRYVGEYKFDRDVMLPLPQGAAKAFDVPIVENSNPWNINPDLMRDEDPQCLKKPDPGPCKGLFERFHYDQQSKSCKPFFWGGCQGTVP